MIVAMVDRGIVIARAKRVEDKSLGCDLRRFVADHNCAVALGCNSDPLDPQS